MFLSQITKGTWLLIQVKIDREILKYEHLHENNEFIIFLISRNKNNGCCRRE